MQGSNSNPVLRGLAATVGLCAAAMAATPASATPINKATSITYSWPSTNKLEPGNCRLPAIFDSSTTTWRNEMSSHGVTLGPNDATIFWNELTDSSFGGSDHNGDNLDHADLVLLATHGGVQGSHTNPSGQLLALTSPSGDPNNDCLVSTSEMRVGNNSSEFQDWYACDSGVRTYLSSFDAVRLTPYLHQLHGFHGTMATNVGSKLDDYLDDAFDGSASWAWVENMTNFNNWGDGVDVCATSLTRGNSTNDANNRAANERYNGGTNFSHPSTSSNFGWMYWVCGCEAHDGAGVTGQLGC